MGIVVRLMNVNDHEFDEFYSHLSVSARRMSRDQMLSVADLLHDMIRERRGLEVRNVFGGRGERQRLQAPGS